MLLFFVYYKSVTWTVFCIVPFLLASWAFTQIWSLRRECVKELEEEKAAVHITDSDLTSEDDEQRPILWTREDAETPRLLMNANTDHVVIQQSPKKMDSQPAHYSIHSLGAHADNKSSGRSVKTLQQQRVDHHNSPYRYPSSLPSN